jgi:hypothetical protein
VSVLLGAPTIMQLRATRFDGEATDEFHWRLRVGATVVGEHSVRPVSGHLRADGPEGWGEVDVSAVLLGTSDASEAELAAVVGESIAAETLYDFARSHLQPLLSQVGSSLRIPYDSPPSAVTVFPSPSAATEGAADTGQARPADSSARPDQA